MLPQATICSFLGVYSGTLASVADIIVFICAS